MLAVQHADLGSQAFYLMQLKTIRPLCTVTGNSSPKVPEKHFHCNTKDATFKTKDGSIGGSSTCTLARNDGNSNPVTPLEDGHSYSGPNRSSTIGSYLGTKSSSEQRQRESSILFPRWCIPAATCYEPPRQRHSHN